ncbi:MFS transporter [Cryptosporangium aurantiacum]|uniref:Drug resistance transporter, EmrB/QacA subfamily n=1 Tax=Cryptosporangium aurantiacum TaxID=134849 RepID=A0A1M7RDQ4_9ACTN|nr:MFS transporter [Cryptosporangium aurantiacum]SHN44168.1 drug resistance transporter, EmrB/QacA subfamily [Cryptosporangium aurantiacum]
MTSQIETPTAPARPPDGYRAGGRLAWLALAVVLVAEVMDLLDTTIVGVASPAIRDDLGGTYASIQWISAGYTLAFAVGLLTAGRLGDLYGRKRLFVIGVAGFTLSSAACALAVSPGMLIGSRLLQGLFAALLIPQGFGLIRAAFPPDQLGKAFAFFGPVMGLSAVAGPIVGGALVDADLFGTGWRMIFLINVPLGLVALIGAVTVLREDRTPSAGGLDPLGAGLATAAAFLVVYPLVQGNELDWPRWIFGCLALGVVLFVLLGVHLVRRSRHGRAPLVMPSLFGKRSFSSSLVVGLLFFAGMSGLMLVMTLYLQIGLGYTPLRAGLTMGPWPFGVAVGAGLAMGVLVPRFGRYVVVGSALVMAAGIAGVWLTLEIAGSSVSSVAFAPGLLVAGIGMGGVVAPFFDIALGDVDDTEVGSASGLLNAIQQLGATVGVAVLTSVFVGLLGSAVISGVGSVTPSLRAELSAAGVPAAAQEEIVADFRDCVRDRATADDPAATPESCRASVTPEVGAVLADEGAAASKEIFTDAAQKLLLIDAALMVVLAGLSFLLPKKARPEEAG